MPHKEMVKLVRWYALPQEYAALLSPALYNLIKMYFERCHKKGVEKVTFHSMLFLFTLNTVS